MRIRGERGHPVAVGIASFPRRAHPTVFTETFVPLPVAHCRPRPRGGRSRLARGREGSLIVDPGREDREILACELALGARSE
jgi:hypothetical protein